MTLSPGMLVNNRYRIVRLLGQGGFGAVYQAWDVNLDRRCALKENLDVSEAVSQQFMREARILANLNHPGLPRVTDYFIVPGQGQYLVMDYIEGEDLERWRQRSRGSVNVNQVLRWMDQVCEALIYLHQQKPPIIHRDIKPANIVITTEGNAVLVDFGIAKLFNPQMRTTVGARAVTPGYSPPEQYGQGVTDERSDIYALGATLYYLLTGESLPDSVDLMTGSAQPLRPVNQINPVVPTHVAMAIAKAMRLSKDERFRTVQEFREALRGSLPLSPPSSAEAVAPRPAWPKPEVVGTPPGGVVVPPRKPSPPLAPPKPSKPPAKGRSGVSVLLGAGAAGSFFGLLLVAVVIFFLWRAVVGNGQPTLSVPQTLTKEADRTPGVTEVETKVPPTKARPTDTPLPPTATEVQPPRPGALLASLPQSALAFVSDHAGDGRDLIYIIEIQGGEYWFSPVAGNQYIFDPINRPAFREPSLVPTDGTHDIAWWPDWWKGNSILFFEAQDSRRPDFQTIYLEVIDDGMPPQAIFLPGFSKLGVPRSAHRNTQMLVSGLRSAGGSSWELHLVDINSWASLQAVGGDGFPFSGNASWAMDDSWAVFMHYESARRVFALYYCYANDFYTISSFGVPAEVVSAKYPSISPKDGRVAYACDLGGSWGLCLQNPDGSGFLPLYKSLGAASGARGGSRPVIPGITPSWSPDGRWLAFASQKDGDWDVYLYGIEWNIELNLTQDMPGDQFQPAWSKP